MIFQGMPWPLVLPVAIMAMIYGSLQAKNQFKSYGKKKHRTKNK